MNRINVHCRGLTVRSPLALSPLQLIRRGREAISHLDYATTLLPSSHYLHAATNTVRIKCGTEYNHSQCRNTCTLEPPLPTFLPTLVPAAITGLLILHRVVRNPNPRSNLLHRGHPPLPLSSRGRQRVEVDLILACLRPFRQQPKRLSQRYQLLQTPQALLPLTPPQPQPPTPRALRTQRPTTPQVQGLRPQQHPILPPPGGSDLQHRVLPHLALLPPHFLLGPASESS